MSGRVATVGALVLFCALAGTARAGELVCKDKIIGINSSAAEVLAACGEPVSKTVETGTVRDAGARASGDVHQSTVEVWRYERHSRKLTTLVTLRDGKVEAIKNKK